MGKVIQRNFTGEHDAGKPRRGQQLRERALSLPGFKRYAIKQQFIVRNPKQKSGVAGFGQRLLQLVPSRLELTFRAFVARTLQPRVLD
jgi:hypothetical protein